MSQGEDSNFHSRRKKPHSSTLVSLRGPKRYLQYLQFILPQYRPAGTDTTRTYLCRLWRHTLNHNSQRDFFYREIWLQDEIFIGWVGLVRQEIFGYQSNISFAVRSNSVSELLVSAFDFFDNSSYYQNIYKFFTHSSIFSDICICCVLAERESESCDVQVSVVGLWRTCHQKIWSSVTGEKQLSTVPVK